MWNLPNITVSTRKNQELLLLLIISRQSFSFKSQHFSLQMLIWGYERCFKLSMMFTVLLLSRISNNLVHILVLLSFFACNLNWNRSLSTNIFHEHWYGKIYLLKKFFLKIYLLLSSFVVSNRPSKWQIFKRVTAIFVPGIHSIFNFWLLYKLCSYTSACSAILYWVDLPFIP